VRYVNSKSLLARIGTHQQIGVHMVEVWFFFSCVIRLFSF